MPMQPLNWEGGPRLRIATGLRATYSIQLRGSNTYFLTGIGHDGLPLLALPVDGKPFTTVGAAMVWAERLDSSRHPEPQISGT